MFICYYDMLSRQTRLIFIMRIEVIWKVDNPLKKMLCLHYHIVDFLPLFIPLTLKYLIQLGYALFLIPI